MNPAAARRAWIVRYLLLWTTSQRTPRVGAHDALGLPMAYELHGYEPHHLEEDLRELYALGVLNRHKGNSRSIVYWLADPAAAKVWVAKEPETALAA